MTLTIDDDKKQVLNQEIGVNPFWGSLEAYRYREITSNLLVGDVPAYALVYSLLNPKGKIILDFGCFQGDSTTRIANMGALNVMGVDTSSQYIEIAEQKKTKANISYSQVHEEEPIPLIPGTSGYDAVAVTFVHPTIADIKLLKTTISKISRVTNAGGQAVFLGLNPGSFDPRYNFINYAHGLPEGKHYEDGHAFPNRLKTNDGSEVAFSDYCWTEETLTRLMLEGGFSDVRVIYPTLDLEGEEGNVLRSSINTLQLDRNIALTETDEFKVPLHQIIIATK